MLEMIVTSSIFVELLLLLSHHSIDIYSFEDSKHSLNNAEYNQTKALFVT